MLSSNYLISKNDIDDKIFVSLLSTNEFFFVGVTSSLLSLTKSGLVSIIFLTTYFTTVEHAKMAT